MKKGFRKWIGGIAALCLLTAAMAVPSYAAVVKKSASAPTYGPSAGQETAAQSGSAAGGSVGVVTGQGDQTGTAAGVIVETAGVAEAEEPSGGAMNADTMIGTTVTTAAEQTAAGPTTAGSSYFAGSELMLIANRAQSQMESFLITTKNGSLIMIDGGTADDEAHLKEILLSKGGHVSAWLITHPHSDHVGALTKLLAEDPAGITIDNIYYNYAPIEWYFANEEYRAQMVVDNLAALSKLSPSVNHPNIKKGEVIQVDDVRITVMNEPYLFQTNAINNSSVAFRVEMDGKRVLFLGDMGVPAGNSFLNEYKDDPGALRADIVQMAHHGEQGVDRKVYEAIRPTACLWCCPEWLWNNDNGGGMNSGKWKTLEVRGWMRQIGAKAHFVMKDGNQVIR